MPFHVGAWHMLQVAVKPDCATERKSTWVPTVKEELKELQ